MGSSTAIVDELEEREIKAQLQKRIEFNNEEYLEESTHLGSIVKEQLRLSKRTGNAIDLYFPHEIYVPIFQGLLRAMQHRFTSQMVLEPFDVGILGSVSNIDPSKLRIEDIVSIRQEGAFEEFRVFLRRAFERLHTAHNFSDFETEFAAACRQELKENAEAIRAKTQKSSVLREIFSNYDKILIGAAAGALSGALTGPQLATILGSAAIGTGSPAYEVIREWRKGSPNSKARTSLRNHFLAIQSGISG